MTLWIALGALSLVAIGFVVWPLYRKSGQLTPLLAGIIILTVGLSAGLYQYIGSPGVSSGASSLPDIDEIVVSLEKRLEETPDDELRREMKDLGFRWSPRRKKWAHNCGTPTKSAHQSSPWEKYDHAPVSGPSWKTAV